MENEGRISRFIALFPWACFGLLVLSQAIAVMRLRGEYNTGKLAASMNYSEKLDYEHFKWLIASMESDLKLIFPKALFLLALIAVLIMISAAVGDKRGFAIRQMAIGLVCVFASIETWWIISALGHDLTPFYPIQSLLVWATGFILVIDALLIVRILIDNHKAYRN